MVHGERIDKMFSVPVTFHYSFNDLDETARRCVMAEFAANGAKHLVLTDGLIEKILCDISMMDKLDKEMHSAGLTFADAHAPFGIFVDLNNPDERLRPKIIRRHQEHINIAADMGVNTITIHIGNEYCHPQVSLDKQTDNVIDALDKLLPTAEERGVTICIENIWCRLNTPEQLLRIKEHFPTDALGFCFDAGHANNVEKGYLYERNSVYDSYILTNTPAVYDDKVQEKMLPHIVNCHLHDNDGQFDTHLNVFDGNIDWQKVIRLLRQAPRLKCIQSEVIAMLNCVPIRTLCETFDRLGEIE